MSSRESGSGGDRRDRDRSPRRDDRRDRSSPRRDRSPRRDDRSTTSSSSSSGGGSSKQDFSHLTKEVLNGHTATQDGRFSGTSARYEGRAEGIEKRVFIGGLNADTTRDEKTVRSTFEQYGKIMSLNVKSGFAFLEYDTAEEAKAAVQNLDGGRCGTSEAIKVNHARGPGVAPGYRCYQCGKDGHFARACKSGDGSTARCYKCGSRSHIERNCPRSRSRSRGRRSRSRGRDDRRRSRSRDRRDDRRGGGGGSSSHHSSSSSNKRSRSRSRGRDDRRGGGDDRRRSRSSDRSKQSSSHRSDRRSRSPRK